jgi:hypothetical protein
MYRAASFAFPFAVVNEITMEDVREDRRSSDSGGRRKDDNNGLGIKEIIAICGFVLTLGTVVWSSARSVAATQMAVSEMTGMRAQLTQMDGKLNAMALTANGLDKEVEFLRRQFEEYKREQFSANELRDTYIKNDRERIIALEKK